MKIQMKMRVDEEGNRPGQEGSYSGYDRVKEWAILEGPLKKFYIVIGKEGQLGSGYEGMSSRTWVIMTRAELFGHLRQNKIPISDTRTVIS